MSMATTKKKPTSTPTKAVKVKAIVNGKRQLGLLAGKITMAPDAFPPSEMRDLGYYKRSEAEFIRSEAEQKRGDVKPKRGDAEQKKEPKKPGA